ncbi:3'-exoribonuclease [Deltaproteobacteria bacterium]|nr:3'-exoribonuclease [Deltaproteobacteria bacterium]
MNAEADVNALRRRLSSEEINSLPLYRYGGEVHLVRSLTELKRVLSDLAAELVLGFDTETRPSFHKGKINAPSLIQLSTERAVYLIQLACLPFGRHLADILANPDQIKAGVSIRDDMSNLAGLHSFEPAGLADLGALARAGKFSSHGLRTLAATLFGRRISKGSRCSDWSLAELSHRQIAYAATDAWIGRLIFLRMRELGLAPGGSSGQSRSSALDLLTAQEDTKIKGRIVHESLHLSAELDDSSF